MAASGFLRQSGFFLLALLWLPAGIVGAAAFRGLGPAEFGSWKMAVLTAFQSFVLVAPCGLLLALPCRRLWRLGYHRAAWAMGTALGTATATTSLFAGLLGPLGIAVYAAVQSLPAWITVIWLNRKQR